MDTLPKNPGSVVKFLLQPEDYSLDPEPEDRPVWHVATLIPGTITADGVVHDAVWAGAYVDSPDDESNVFAEDYILGFDPVLVVETVPASENPDLVAAVIENGLRTVGLVVNYPEHESEPDSTFTFAPSFIDVDEEGGWELVECMFVNSYGGWLSASSHDENDLKFLFVPTTLI